METYSNVEVRKIVRILWANRFTNTKIPHEMSTVYGPNAMSQPTILKLCHHFEVGRTDLTDTERQERPTTMSTSEMVQT